ncbi:uncharacterized protein LOC133391169 [Anopheles gambiae]|uniref:uncharacterized protein LOC133391169 n=1 Tax=Anopheles gambiae TaxID=7165 RepID=UPI002AC93527|nr:uncharacterized protein LOC133391169 [Anopheles gambiae]
MIPLHVIWIAIKVILGLGYSVGYFHTLQSYRQSTMAWKRMLLVGLAVGVIFAAVAEPTQIPKTISSLVEECFHHNSRTLYLVGLEKLAAYESYLALPHPKVIVQSGYSIGTPDESSLIVMYMDCSTLSNLLIQFKAIMRDFTRIVRNGKYIVLVEDAYLSNGNLAVAIELGSAFSTYNVVYWCVTGLHQAEELQYTLFFASSVYFMNGPLTYAPAFEWNRGLLRNATFDIYALAMTSFPYTHFQGKHRPFCGIDVNIFETVMERIGCQLKVRILQPTDSIDNDIAVITRSLHRSKADVMMTRRHVNVGILPVVYIPDITYYCLVAPRTTQIDLTQSLLRPFSGTVWWFIVVCTVLISAFDELSKQHTRLGRLAQQLFARQPIASFYRICLAVISFVLIESYLATVTSFFLAYRFVPDAKTLEEFFATGIPIRLPEGMVRFLRNLEPRLKDRIMARGVGASVCSPYSTQCAHLESFAMASYQISENVGIDPVSGRKRSYIVPEMVTRYSYLSYAFARGSPLTDLVAMYLRWMYEAGLMGLFRHQYEQYLQPTVHVHTVVDSSLEFEHLMSLWICVSIGWGVSCGVFVMEMGHGWLQRVLKGRRQVAGNAGKQAWCKVGNKTGPMPGTKSVQ